MGKDLLYFYPWVTLLTILGLSLRIKFFERIGGSLAVVDIYQLLILVLKTQPYVLLSRLL